MKESPRRVSSSSDASVKTSLSCGGGGGQINRIDQEASPPSTPNSRWRPERLERTLLPTLDGRVPEEFLKRNSFHGIPSPSISISRIQWAHTVGRFHRCSISEKTTNRGGSVSSFHDDIAFERETESVFVFVFVLVLFSLRLNEPGIAENHGLPAYLHTYTYASCLSFSTVRDETSSFSRHVPSREERVKSLLHLRTKNESERESVHSSK